MLRVWVALRISLLRLPMVLAVVASSLGSLVYVSCTRRLHSLFAPRPTPLAALVCVLYFFALKWAHGFGWEPIRSIPQLLGHNRFTAPQALPSVPYAQQLFFSQAQDAAKQWFNAQLSSGQRLPSSVYLLHMFAMEGPVRWRGSGQAERVTGRNNVTASEGGPDLFLVSRNEPRHSHSFGVFYEFQLTPDPGEDRVKLVRAFTISWLPHRLNREWGVCVDTIPGSENKVPFQRAINCMPELGRNWSLTDSLGLAAGSRKVLLAWEPHVISEFLFKKAQIRFDLLTTGYKVPGTHGNGVRKFPRYLAVPSVSQRKAVWGSAPYNASFNCMHALADMLPASIPHLGASFGFGGSLNVLRYFDRAMGSSHASASYQTFTLLNAH